MLADLPGYGYARAEKEKVLQWTTFTNDYLKGRPLLRRVCLLIDSRHGIKDKDRSIMAMLDKAAVPFQAVLTKCDKITGEKLAMRLSDAKNELATHPAAHPEVIATSSNKKTGLDDLRKMLAALAERPE